MDDITVKKVNSMRTQKNNSCFYTRPNLEGGVGSSHRFSLAKEDVSMEESAHNVTMTMRIHILFVFGINFYAVRLGAYTYSPTCISIHSKKLQTNSLYIYLSLIHI